MVWDPTSTQKIDGFILSSIISILQKVFEYVFSMLHANKRRLFIKYLLPEISSILKRYSSLKFLLGFHSKILTDLKDITKFAISTTFRSRDITS